ncbi:hypothetical protein PsorP6_007586 [Peronosclerospora sorghi]|uniref:Uncharacterized protein n=1 Tax=Peronosclerospora sorghi TaxID=230839 RepID=A0ACC0W731_9STRA|nr:hypothetical protein PsorP6_007586 [Peronosclerospora sorghi]
MISELRQQKATEVVDFVTLHYRVGCVCAKPVELMVDFSGGSNSRFESRALCFFTKCCTCKYYWNPIDRCFCPIKGIKLMLENRVIPEDVDVNEVLAKVVAIIKYQAFGRAALTDEVDKILSEEMIKPNSAIENMSVSRDKKTQDGYRCAAELVSQTDAELFRSIHASTRPSATGENEVIFCSSMRATIVLLAKIRFLSMRIDVLQHLVSYGSELRDHVLHDLTRCLVGAMKLRLAVA